MRWRRLSKKAFIDSNIFFYSIIMDREYGEHCAAILRGIHEGRLRAYISPLILLEVANALRKFHIEQFHIKIKAIVSLPISLIEIETEDILDAIEFADKYDISPYDASHVIAMKKAKIDIIISADKDFDKVDIITRIDPKKLRATHHSDPHGSKLLET